VRPPEGGDKNEHDFSECRDLLNRARKRQEGQTMAEYAVVLGVFTLAVVGVFTALAGGPTARSFL
jgi:Flp pilus assembly pilin Flp